jgi:hypothetical protein
MRLVLLAATASVLAACADWRPAYLHEARRECQEEINPDARRACFDNVEKRAETLREQQRDDGSVN